MVTQCEQNASKESEAGDPWLFTLRLSHYGVHHSQLACLILVRDWIGILHWFCPRMTCPWPPARPVWPAHEMTTLCKGHDTELASGPGAGDDVRGRSAGHLHSCTPRPCREFLCRNHPLTSAPTQRKRHGHTKLSTTTSLVLTPASTRQQENTARPQMICISRRVFYAWFLSTRHLLQYSMGRHGSSESSYFCD